MRTKRLLFAIMAMFLPLVANAKDVTVNGINYYISEEGELRAGVVQNTDVAGDIVVPEYITVGNLKYPVTYIGDNAFRSCSGLTSVTIPNSVTSICNYAFCNCSGLTSIVVPNSVSYIGEWAFSNRSLKEITIGSGVKCIERDAFTGCDNLENVYISDFSAWCSINFKLIQSCDEDDGTYGNPLKYAKHLYLNGRELKDLPDVDNLVSISDDAFYGFSGFTSLTIPDGVKSIGARSFMGCANASSLTIPSSVTSIGDYGFAGCRGLTSATIPSSVTSTGIETFSYWSSLTSVNVSVVDLSAFCTNKIIYTIKRLTAASIRLIDEEGKEITEYVVPNGVTTIGESAFYGCNGLTSVTIGNNVKGIREKAFMNCSGLTSVILGDNMTYIGESAFMGCSGIVSLNIPGNVTTIYKNAFKDCSGLNSVTMGNGVQLIKDGAFQNCTRLASVSVGKSVSSIESNAFGNCEKLADFTCYAVDVPTARANTFYNHENITLHVNEASIDKYRSYNPWASFKSIVAADIPMYTLTYMVDGEVYKTYKHEEGDKIIPEAEPTREGYLFMGWSEIPETMPDHDVTVTGNFYRLSLGKCSAPTINIIDGEIVFTSEMEDVEYHYEIVCLDEGSGVGNKIKLTKTYRIRVYAKKEGYEDSQMITKDIQVSADGFNGDANNDGTVNAADIVSIVNMIMSSKE